MKKSLAILALLSLVGCSSVDPVNVSFTSTKTSFIHPDKPSPMVLSPVLWNVLTDKNSADKLKANDVLFCVPTDGYKNVAGNMTEFLRYLKSQNVIIDYYRNTIPNEIVTPAPVTKTP